MRSPTSTTPARRWPACSQLEEEFGDVAGRRLAFVGVGGDNVAHSLLEVGALSGLDVDDRLPARVRA